MYMHVSEQEECVPLGLGLVMEDKNPLNHGLSKNAYKHTCIYLFCQLGLEQLLIVHLLGNLLCKALSKLRIRLEPLLDGLHPGMNLRSVLRYICM